MKAKNSFRNKIVFVNIKDKPATLSDLNKKGGSGTVSSMLWIAKGIAEQGHDASVLYRTCTETVEQGVGFLSAGRHDVKDVLQNLAPHIVIVVGHSGHLLFDRRLSPGLIVYWAQNWLETEKYANAFSSRYFDKYIFASNYHHIKTFWSMHFNNDFYNNSVALPNPVDLSAIIRKQNYKMDDTVKIGFIGFPSATKGFPEVCDITYRLNIMGINAILTVYGDLSLYGQIGDMSDSSPHMDYLVRTGRIQWQGTIGRLRLYRDIIAQDVIIGGMKGTETFCVALAEAQAAGIPVISLKRGGQISYIRHKQSGFLVGSVMDAVQYVKKLKKLSVQERADMGVTGVSATANLHYQHIARQWLLFLTDLSKPKHMRMKTGYISACIETIILQLKERLRK